MIMSEFPTGSRRPDDEGATLEMRVAALLSQHRFAKAAEVIMAELGPGVRAFIRRRVGGEDEDLLQDLYEKIRHALPSFEVRDSAKIQTWLLTICSNLLCDKFRADKRKRSRQVQMDPQGWANVAGQSGGELDRQLDKGRRSQQLHWVIELLPEDDRMLLVIHAQEGLTFRQLGDRFGKSEAAVKMQYHRVRKRCKELIRSLRRGLDSSAGSA